MPITRIGCCCIVNNTAVRNITRFRNNPSKKFKYNFAMFGCVLGGLEQEQSFQGAQFYRVLIDIVGGVCGFKANQAVFVVEAARVGRNKSILC